MDQASLADLGRWPWPRSVHAEFLRRLSSEQPRAVAFDIIFAEPSSDHSGDAALASAIRDNGRVVLPVLMEQSRASAVPTETLPLPSVAAAAAGLGHVHVEIDPDGIARSIYRYEGLGSPHWPHLAEALLAVGNQHPVTPPKVVSGPSMVWSRADQMLIPYAGPPGHFPRFSYSQLLNGEFLPGTFTDKFILIGVTATGLGDALPTPLSGFSSAMPGVEVNANILDALQAGLQVEPFNPTWQLILTLLVAVSPAIFFVFLTPRNALLTSGFIILATLAATTFLLWRFHTWFAPVPALVPVALSYPLWSWRRLEQAVRYFNQELDDLQGQREALGAEHYTSLETALNFLSKILPVGDWSLQNTREPSDAATRTQLASGPSDTVWYLQKDVVWCSISPRYGGQWLRLNWIGDAPPTARQWIILDQLVIEYGAPTTVGAKPRTILQSRIGEVQTIARQLQELRGFVDDTLANMSDGVLVVDTFGQVFLSNARAGAYLTGDETASLDGQSLLDLLADLSLQDGSSWLELLKATAVEQEHVQVTARHQSGQDLLVQMAPLSRIEKDNHGLIVSLSDISPLLVSERKRTELLNYLSHDLRSPLVSVLALCELASNSKPNDEIQSLIGRMRLHAENTLGLAEQFLQLARAENIGSHAFYEVDMIAVVENACEQVWTLAHEKQMKIDMNLEVEEAWVLGDGSLLERALVNLLTNAIKYSPAESEIRVSLRQQDHNFCCCVSDRGAGIAPESLPRLFDRFERVGQNDGDGAGLGLAFVATVASRHRGDVTVQSELGEGSIFCLLLPAEADSNTSSNDLDETSSKTLQ